MAESDNVPAYVALQAINSALDRAGVTEPNQVEVTVKPFESLLADVEGGSRADYRRSIGDERADDEPLSIEHHHRPGGPATEASGVGVLGELPDGSLVIDVDPADDDAGELDDARRHTDASEAHRAATETLANSVAPLSPVRGYLPADEAHEVAAEANRAYRHRMTRR